MEQNRMKNSTRLILPVLAPLMLLSAAMLFSGCQSSEKSAAQTTVAVPTKTWTPVHIKAAAAEPFTDPQGVIWLAGAGFSDGETIEHEDLQIANTTNPGIYRSERYSMTAFSYPVPNGRYIVKLHFCETYDGITGPGQRVFSFNVEGHPFKNFDVWVKAGGPERACVETVPVTVTDGKLDITFESIVENPQINGIEIFPAP
jgi:hypothetical protein